MKKKGQIIGFSLILFLLCAGVFYLLDQKVLQGKAVATIGNVLSATQAHPVIVKISISEDDMARMKMQREQALERGIMTNEGNNYVPATIVYGKDKSQAEIRLKGHMTDHLQDKKWSFRVKPDKKLNDMKRFTLQHPGTRNYLYEFLFHLMAKDLGIVALRYDFVKVYVNDEDWGIYAMEEHLTKQMLKSNGKENGPIIRFNPELYWAGRLNELEGAHLAEDQNTLYGSFPEAYGMGGISKDDSLLTLYREAHNKLFAFVQGKVETSHVFDIEKLAKYHALIDLVGGHHSLDWSDVKYYYNPKTRLLEPVAYESFSIRKTKTLAGSFKYDQWNDRDPSLHALLFSDKAFFKAYMNAVKTLSKKKFMDEQLAKHQERLSRKNAILSLQYAYKTWNVAPYYENQQRMKALLKPKLHVRAYAYEKNGKLHLQIANLTNLPIEIKKIDYGKEKLKPNWVVAPKKRFNFPLPIEFETTFDFKKGESCKIKTEVLGLSNEVAIEALPIQYDIKSYEKEIKTGNLPQNLMVDSARKTAIILSGKVEHSFRVGKDWMLKVYPGTKVELAKNIQIQIEGRSNFRGTEDNPIEITLSPGAGINNQYIAQWDYTHFNGKDSSFITNQSTLKMNYCIHKDVDILNRENLMLRHCFLKNNVTALRNEKGYMDISNSIINSTICFENLMGIGSFSNCKLFGEKVIAGYASKTTAKNCNVVKIEQQKTAEVKWG